jgi:Rha family phage regulatory protein
MEVDGLFADKKTERVLCDSRFVAEAFSKEHFHVLRDIQSMLSPDSGYSTDFGASNFGLSSYKNSQGKKQPCYNLSRDGFTALVMGYSGSKANIFKEKYIKRFNEMELRVKSLKHVREGIPLFTEQISSIHENPKSYHFSNECDMINRIVLGKTAKEYKRDNGLPESATSIRPYLTKCELDMIDNLQILDAGMIEMGADYEQRKSKLTAWALRKNRQDMIMQA